MDKKVAFFTLGCKVNYCDTEGMQEMFTQAGYEIVDFNDCADVYVINTCTVTGSSDHKSRKAVRRARKQAPEATVIVTGCYAQRKQCELEGLGQADYIIGNKDRQNLPHIINQINTARPINMVSPYHEDAVFEILPPVSQPGRTRGFLKIQDGCNQYCSYCIIPHVRGPLRSLSPEEVMSRAKRLVETGCREIVLNGIHLGLYGEEMENVTLASLIKEIEKIPGLLRLRLSSIEPTDVTGELVEAMVRSKVLCPNLHIPLQSGDNEILKRMNRPYEAVEYLYLANWLKQEIPRLSLSSDLIVGFPGETEENHRNSLALVQEIGFSRLHVFKYSSRPGTAAASFEGQLSNEIKEKRSGEMIALGEKMSSSYRRQFVGSVQPVLIEKVVPYRYMEGLTTHYLRVRIAIQQKGLQMKGKEVKAHINRELDSILLAEEVPGGKNCRQLKIDF